jgi:hypothetical protein
LASAWAGSAGFVGGCAASGRGERSDAGEVVVLDEGAGELFAPFPLEPLVLKYAAQLGSTLPGSRWNCSYISSTSHSLAPKSEEGAEAGSDGESDPACELVSDWVSDGFVCCCGTG